MARRSARALVRTATARTHDAATSSPTPPIRNAMAVHAAFGGSTNLLLHIPAIAFAAGLRAADRRRLARDQPPGAAAGRALPNGPVDHPTVRVFLAGGVPEVMLHLRELGPARRIGPDRDRRAAGASRSTGGKRASAGSGCASRSVEQDGVDPDDVIMSPARAQRARPDQHRDLPARQPRPRRARSSRARRSIRRVVDADGVYRKIGPARVFTTRAATPSPPSRARAPTASSRATCWC